MRQTSASELAAFFQRQRNDRLKNDFPGFAAVVRPKCYICKREVQMSEEYIEPDGIHVIKVHCHGKKETCVLTPELLDYLMNGDCKMEAGWAFMPEEEKKKIEHYGEK